MPEQTLQSIAFPTLSDAQMREFQPVHPRRGAQGLSRWTDPHRAWRPRLQVLHRHIRRDRDRRSLRRRPKTVTIHGKGEFTGDVAHLTGRASVISAVARGDCEVDEISGDALRGALNQCPMLSDIILQAFIARRQLLRESGDFTGLRVIGSRYSTDTFRVRDFLAKNRVPFTWLDVETDPEVDQLLKHFGVTEADTPVVACGDMLLRNPSNRELADAIGLRQPLEHIVYDLVVVGAGPAGLAAAVYGASEGLRTVVVERTAPGGQAGASMRIENYLGFPTGITGQRTGRPRHPPGQQVRRAPVSAHAGDRTDVRERLLRAAPGRRRNGHGQVPADRHGRRLPPAGRRERGAVRGPGCLLRRHPGRGPALPRSAGGRGRRRQLGRPGGGVSGPAARRLQLVIRGDDLYKSMSSYLARRIEQTRTSN